MGPALLAVPPSSEQTFLQSSVESLRQLQSVSQLPGRCAKTKTEPIRSALAEQERRPQNLGLSVLVYSGAQLSRNFSALS